MGKFQKLYEDVKNKLKYVDLEDKRHMIDQYRKTAVWSSNLDDDNPKSPYVFTKSAMDKMKKDCEKFLTDLQKELDKYNKTNNNQVSISELLDGKSRKENYEMLGHNFWLSRNKHGAGFFDGDYDEDIEKSLTKLSDKAEDDELYVTDDGKIDIM